MARIKRHHMNKYLSACLPCGFMPLCTKSMTLSGISTRGSRRSLLLLLKYALLTSNDSMVTSRFLLSEFVYIMFRLQRRIWHGSWGWDWGWWWVALCSEAVAMFL